MLTKKSNYSLNNYLEKLDYINKYNLDTFYKIPKVESIKFTIYGNINQKYNAYYKSTFFLYILTSRFPEIKAAGTTNVYTDKESNSYVLTIFLKTSKEIDTFLMTFFFEIFKTENTDLFTLTKRYFIYTTPLSNFIEINKFSRVGINTNDSVSIRFQFSSNTAQSSFRNLASFWRL